MKTQFLFDPTVDEDIPCKEAGLAFQKGDILEVLDQSDATWWQVDYSLHPKNWILHKTKTAIILTPCIPGWHSCMADIFNCFSDDKHKINKYIYF